MKLISMRNHSVKMLANALTRMGSSSRRRGALLVVLCLSWYSSFRMHSRSMLTTGMVTDDSRLPLDTFKTVLTTQIQTQNNFQKLVYDTQHPKDCARARILYRKKAVQEKDGFATELNFFTHYLHVAVATRRALVVDPDYPSAYASSGCRRWSCLFELPSHCKLSENVGGSAETDDPSSMGAGIVQEPSRFFNSHYYGRTRQVFVPNRVTGYPELVDVVPDYDRRFGRYWVNAQISHYLWNNMKSELRNAVSKRLPKQLKGQPFVGFHLRLTDNTADMLKDFGRNATITRTLDRFMDLTKQHAPHITNIFVATDNQDIIEKLKQENSDYTFHWQEDVLRSTNHAERNWYASQRQASAVGIASDIEILRRADVLVGSFHSNVYRLVAQLNTCYHVEKYAWNDQRHFTVDVEWFEEP